MLKAYPVGKARAFGAGDDKDGLHPVTNGLSSPTQPETKPLQNLYEPLAIRSSLSVNLLSARQPLWATSVKTRSPLGDMLDDAREVPGYRTKIQITGCIRERCQ